VVDIYDLTYVKRKQTDGRDDILTPPKERFLADEAGDTQRLRGL
jgi:hypothetical protein